ncbi:hypothetical protein RI129_010667 [Pyrocoelia pectoralis]|uniref:Uncharacterized protein n=1 Tax=Pyrocoelia pectoralis TaxID=417401 RepID=A0AAN7V7D7_9COLE
METENSGDHIKEAITNVYMNCDISNNNSVSVSKLLNFISSSDSGNVFEFSQLETMLDPDGIDPCVTCEEFVVTVGEWTRNNVTNLRSELVQTLSSVTKDEVCHNTSGSVTYDQEYVRKLEMKYQMAVKQLEDLKEQLMAAEEQNDLLQNENDGILQKFSRSAALNKIDEELTDGVECVAELKSFYEKEMFKLKKSVTTYEKEITTLNNSITNHIEEKKTLEDKMKTFDKKIKDQIKLLYKLDVELNNKEQSILSLSESNSQLQSKLNKQDEYMAQYCEIINILKDEKKTLAESIHEYVMECSYTKQLKHAPRTSLTSLVQSPMSSKILSDVFKFNSPNLLFNLQNPVSPNLDSPLVNKINNNDIEIVSPLSEINDSVFISPKFRQEDYIENEEENMETSIVNDVCLENSLKALCNGRRRDSLSDEIFVADEEFHRNECLQLLAKQKLDIEELEEETEHLNANIKQLSEHLDNDQKRIEELTSAQEEQEKSNTTLLNQLEESRKFIDALILEKEQLLVKLAEPTVSQDSNKNFSKQNNFSKMEVKLERRDEKIEELYKLLKFEKVNYEKILSEKYHLKEELKLMTSDYNNLMTEKFTLNTKCVKLEREFENRLKQARACILIVKAKHIQLTESVRDLLTNFKFTLDNLPIEILKFNCECIRSKMTADVLVVSALENSELEQLSDQISSDEMLRVNENMEECNMNSELYAKLANAFNSDLKTIDDRLQLQEKSQYDAQQVLFGMFDNVKLLLKTVEPHLSFNSKSFCEQELENVKEDCSNAIKVVTQYGKLLHEQSQLKFLGAFITRSHYLERSYEHELNQNKKLNAHKNDNKKNSSVCYKIGTYFLMFLSIVFILLVYVTNSGVLVDIINSIHVKKSYCHPPPT